MRGDPKRRAQAQFGAAAEAYASSDVHARGDSLAMLLELTHPMPAWTVVDVATGAGHTALSFAPHVARVIATDITAEMIRKTRETAHTRRLHNLHVSIGDAELLPIASGVADIVACRLAFHHFPSPTHALAEFSRILRPDGVLALSDNVTVEDEDAARYYNTYERLRDPSHHCVYSLARLRQMLVQEGFVVETTRRLTKEFEFEQWADRQHVSARDKVRLLAMMRELPGSLEALFAPRWVEETMYFSLWEAVVIARRRPR